MTEPCSPPRIGHIHLCYFPITQDEDLHVQHINIVNFIETLKTMDIDQICTYAQNYNYDTIFKPTIEILIKAGNGEALMEFFKNISLAYAYGQFYWMTGGDGLGGLRYSN